MRSKHTSIDLSMKHPNMASQEQIWQKEHTKACKKTKQSIYMQIGMTPNPLLKLSRPRPLDLHLHPT